MVMLRDEQEDVQITHPFSHRFERIHMERSWLNTYNTFGIASQIELPAENTSLIEIFERNAHLFAERTAFIHQQHELSFADLEQYSLKFAHYLQQLGLKSGSRIAIMMPNCLQYPVAVLAILRAGYIIVNVNPLYTPRELEYQLNDAGAEVILLLDSCVATFAQIAQNTSVKHCIVSQIDDLFSNEWADTAITVENIPHPVSLHHALLKGQAEQYVRPSLNLETTAVLQYTGGTTGLSKGAELTHKNLIANILQTDEMFHELLGGYGATEAGKYPILCALPLYHIFAFTVCSLFGMYKGQTNILISNPRDLTVVIDAMRQYQPAFFPSVNTLYNALVNNEAFQQLDHSNLRIAAGGGMSVLPATAEKWKNITGRTIIEAYGLSETSPVATCNPTQHQHFSGMVGIPVSSTDVVILDDDGQVIPAGTTDEDGELVSGEISIRGPQIMKGYWNKPEETAKVMTADGFFRSGDVGVMDDQGFVKIVDRKKDMIIVSGFNVYPNEIESIITKHPKVLEAAAIGVPDEHSGEVPKIFVVKKDDSLTADEIITYAREYLTGYKIPRHVEFIAELPKSNVGKILRRNLRN